MRQLTELKERCVRLENQCKAKHAAGERSKALNNFNDKFNSVRLISLTNQKYGC